jgi:type II secretory pathway pseudopilin PulG
MHRASQGFPGSARRAGALGAALAVLAIAASGCGEGLKNAVDSARSLQQQGSNALTQAQQQAQSVQSELQQQAPQSQNGGGNYGY